MVVVVIMADAAVIESASVVLNVVVLKVGGVMVAVV